VRGASRERIGDEAHPGPGRRPGPRRSVGSRERGWRTLGQHADLVAAQIDCAAASASMPPRFARRPRESRRSVRHSLVAAAC
jgi:hypothetical protein